MVDRCLFQISGREPDPRFRFCFISNTTQTGDIRLKALHEHLFVGTGLFIVEAGKELGVQYQIGRLVG